MKKWGLLIAVILMIVLRVVALRSDSYVRLDWSAGQLTDEGFYIHNARNVILFGHAQTDDFNNMLLAPLLHYFQVFWFEIFGVGAVQARMISVLCSLLSLWLFWKALRRIFGVRIAWVGALFLGFDHTYLLFNRMALMDTPAALAAIASFYFFVLGVTEGNRWWRAICFFMSGVMLGVLLGVRSLCAWLIPAPVAALWAGNRKKEVIALSVGFILAMSIWVIFWYLPHFAEMTMMANYYRKNQLQPHSWARLGANIWVGFMGDFRGIAPYVFRHTPVLLTLAILALFFGRIALKDIKQDCADWSARKIVFIYLCCWFVFSWGTFVIICYAPGRYYVPIYPAIAALAAIAACSLSSIAESFLAQSNNMIALRFGLIWWLSYHAMESLVHHERVLPHLPTMLILYGVPTLTGVFSAWYPVRRSLLQIPVKHSGWFLPAAFALWLIVNCAWLGNWAYHISYTQYNTSRWLQHHLPPNSVLIGAIAPGLSMNNDFMVVHVQDHLCNDHHPVERYSKYPEYIVILDRKWKEAWWNKHYPELVDPKHLFCMPHVMKWYVGIYAVNSKDMRTDMLSAHTGINK